MAVLVALRPPSGRWAWLLVAGDVALLCLLGLTGPFALPAAPLYAAAAWRRGTRHAAVLAAAVAGCAALQASVLLFASDLAPGSAPAAGLGALQPREWAVTLANRCGYGLFVGPANGLTERGLPRCALLALLAPAVAMLALPRAGLRLLAGFGLAFALALVVAGVAGRPREDAVHWMGYLLGDRYFLPYAILLAWALGIAAATARGLPRVAAACLLLAMAGPAHAGRWTGQRDYPDCGWASVAADLDAGRFTVASANPGWRLPIGPRVVKSTPAATMPSAAPRCVPRGGKW